MQSLTTGAQQGATWATGDIVVYGGAIGVVIAGFMCFQRGVAIGIFLCTIIGVAIASGGLGISRGVYNWFHSASLAAPVYASAEPACLPYEFAPPAFRMHRGRLA